MADFIDDDFVAMRDRDGDIMLMLAFGDEIEIIDDAADPIEVRAVDRWNGMRTGFIDAGAARRPDRILKFSIVDVQQGDGMVLETPGGKIVLIDGGDVPLFARHVASRFFHRQPTVANPLEVDAIVITHGDADHFDGLNDMRRSETEFDEGHRKHLPIHPQRLFTNGLVKLKRDRPDTERLGATIEHDGHLYVTDLYDDPRDADPAEVNRSNTWFTTSLNHWEAGRVPIECRRVDAGMDPADVFGFLDGDVGIEILGPFTDQVPADDGGGDVPGLRFLRSPPSTPEVHLASSTDGGSRSMSHTINGHSIGLRLTYGNVRLVLTGDMNTPSMREMQARLPADALVGEFVKAPHHGSHEFDLDALRLMKPVVAAISSGDESEFKEHIHPRATLLAALGQAIDGDVGAIFCTELAAFFKYEKDCYRRDDLADFFGSTPDAEFTGEDLRRLFSGVPRAEDPPGMFAGFRRTNFGIINLRTDGERMLVFTYSGERFVHEAYRFRVGRDATGDRTVKFEPVSTA